MKLKTYTNTKALLATILFIALTGFYDHASAHTNGGYHADQETAYQHCMEYTINNYPERFNHNCRLYPSHSYYTFVGWSGYCSALPCNQQIAPKSAARYCRSNHVLVNDGGIQKCVLPRFALAVPHSIHTGFRAGVRNAPCLNDCRPELAGQPVNTITGHKEKRIILGTINNETLELNYINDDANNIGIGINWEHSFQRRLTITEPPTHTNSGDYAAATTTYLTPQEACNNGWNYIKATNSFQPWMVNTSSSLSDNNTCHINHPSGSLVTILPVLTVGGHGSTFIVNPTPEYTLHLGNGRLVTLLKLKTGWHFSNGDPAPFTDITYEDGTVSHYEFTPINGELQTYDATGKHVSTIKASGRSYDLHYNSENQLEQIIFNSGESLTLVYNDDRIHQFRASTGAKWALGYDTAGNLSNITYPDTTTKLFHYEDRRFPNHMTGLTDEGGVRIESYAYDDQGRGIETQKTNNISKISISYPDEYNRTITNSLGQTTNYRIAPNKVEYVVGPGCATCLPGDSSYTYDTRNNLTSKTTQGHRTEYGDYDSNGNYGYKIEAAGTADARRTDYSYDPRFISKVATVTEPSIYTGAHKVTTYDYDDAGNTTQIKIEGFTTDGQPVSRIVNMSYDGPFKQLTAIDGPRSDVDDITTLHYYPNDPAQGHNRARLQSVVDANGVAVRDNIQYSATGKVLSEQRPNGLTLNYEYYPGNDRLKKVTHSDGANQRHTYWTYLATGEVETITSAYGSSEASTITFGYDDARHLVNVSDDAGNRIVYTLDTEGNLLNQQTFDADNQLTQTLSQTFDSYSRLKTRIGADDQTTQYDYNNQGLLERETDARNHVTEYGYDDLQRLTQVSAELGSVSSYAYDVQDNLTQVTDPNGNSTAYQYDDLGNLRQQTSPDTGVTQYHYDAAGNLTQQVDAKGQSTSYAYDALNRITTITYNDGSVTTYGYDQGDTGYGRLGNITTTDSSIAYHYNAFGEVVTIDHAMHDKTFTLSHRYNAAGQVKQTTYPSGMVIDYRYAHGKVSAIEIDGQPLLEAIRYQPFSAVAGWQWGNGQLHDRSYNLDGQLDSYDLAGQVYTLLYDAVGNLKQRSSDSSLSDYDYDALNRLATESGDHQRGYLYDTNGNRSQLTEGGDISTYLYNSHNNQLTDILGQLNQSYQYDANGNLIDDGQFQYHYDARNRLININNQTHYQHNGLGQRISKHGRGFAPGDANGDNAYSRADVDAIVSHILALTPANGNSDCNEDGHITIFDVVCVNTKISANETPIAGQRTTLFVYDLNGQLIGEYDDQGNAIQETIYLGNMPVATVKNSNIYYIHSDHLNTPRLITDQTHTPLWTWDSEAFGTTAANEDVDGDGVGFEFNLRFPGQYYDVETGLHYNYFRDYDPSTGRYLQSDPIGLVGGLNTYTYVENNPNGYVDPYGLVAGAAGAGTGSIAPAAGSSTGTGGYDWSAPWITTSEKSYIYNLINSLICGKWGVCNEAANNDSEGQCDEEIKGLTDGLDQETDSRGRPKAGQYGNPDGDAQGDFDSLSGTSVGSGQKVMPDGSIVGIHDSTTTGKVTIHINRPKGKQDIKIRY